MRSLLWFAVGILLSSNILKAQEIDVMLEPITLEEFGGIQSFAFGQYEGKWLIAGGRVDGLHRRQPFAAFDAAGNNNQLIVVDPNTGSHWSVGLSGLSASIEEQLSSTNMGFQQNGDYLYVIGGYGYSDTEADHVTHPYLTAIHLPTTINAIINGEDISPNIRQIFDESFRVTGGHLDKIGNTYYISGGQNFEGRYNPMGPDFGPGFFQEYTNSVRRFNLTDDGVNISASFLTEWNDADNLHRRDYNVVAQIMPDGSEGITAFSGVFQQGADLPYLNCVNINADGYVVNNDFAQYYNHYHCANLPTYSATNNEMHTLFFGGIAQYYDDQGTLVQDDNVPFVSTIARVTRTADGSMAEFKLPTEMPGLLGAGSEFIPLPGLPRYDNGVLKLDELEGDTVLVGHIFGGINSTAANIFFTNDGTQSAASDVIYRVYLITDTPSGIAQLNQQSSSGINMLVYPNPNHGEFIVRYQTKGTESGEIIITDAQGKLCHQKKLRHSGAGLHEYKKQLDGLEKGGVYQIRLRLNGKESIQKIIVQPE